MNNLVIPPSPNWYESSILACAPDNTLIYGSRSDIVIIYDSSGDQPSDVKIIPRAHSQKIVSTNVNKNWGQPRKLLVTAGEDNIIKLWDVATRKKKLGHNAHAGHGKLVGATFAGDDRVISVSEDGVIIVWNVVLNQPNVLKDIFGSKVTITCISTCPHANWLTAFGLKNGLVIITDLRKQGKVLYKLRGHDKCVLSLSWCPVPINIFPKDPHNYVVTKGENESITEIKNAAVTDAKAEANPKLNGEDISKCFTDVPNLLQSQNNSTVQGHNLVVIKDNPASSLATFAESKADVPELNSDSSKLKTENVDLGQTDNCLISKSCKGADKTKKRDIWCNLKHVDDDEHEVSDNETDEGNTSGFDFLTECQNLRELIAENAKNKIKVINPKSEKEERVIMKAKRNQQNQNFDNKLLVETGKEKVDEIVIEEVKETSNDTNICQIEKGTYDYVDLTGMVNPENEVGEEIEETTANKIRSEGELSTCLEKTQLEITSNESIKEKSFERGGYIGETDSQNLLSDEGKEKLKEHTGSDVELKKREIPKYMPVKEEPRKEFLLASSGKEGNIYIWRAGTDGRMQTFLSLINKPGQRRSNKSNSDKLWIVVCWISPTVLLSSSKSAELLKWTLPKPKDKNKIFTTIHCDHTSMLFSMAAPITISNENNWLDERKLNVWTVGHDRLLLNTSISSERRNLACYPTLGNAECLALSPLDPNRLAIGTAEGTVKVWDLSCPNLKNISMTIFFQKIQSKVVTLAWHPKDEMTLAYGTNEGRVGYMDASNKSKSPTLTPNFFKSQIHKVEWGPLNGNTNDFGIFAVAERKLVVFSTKKSEKGPTEVDIPEDTFIYTFAWKPDYTKLLVGSKSGAVILYSPDLKILSIHYFQHKMKDIFWHPEAIHSDATTSKRCYWFAAISNSKDVIVCNFQDDIEDSAKIVSKYERLDDVINHISWSPYSPNEILIASDEGTAQVWNVESDTIISTYTSPNFEGVMSAIWSPIDSDYVISAVKDHTIRVWKISDYPVRDEKEIKELRKKVIKEIVNEQNDLLPKPVKPAEETPNNKKATKTNLLPNFFYQKDAPQVVDHLRKLLLWKEGSYGGETGSGDNNCDILKIFGSKTDILDIIQENEKVHEEKGKFSSSNTLSLFKGDINAKIKQAIDEKRVNPWIIMMAPMVSPKLWQMACEVYAQQLSEATDADPIEVASFYLACHKVEEAINALCVGSMYREALVLAKCRLPEDSTTFVQVLEQWAKYSVYVGNFETAAQCYIYLGKYGDAASVLFRRSDVATLKLAMELAEKSGNEELCKAVTCKYNAYKSENGTEDKVYPSKVDAVLKLHLENKKNGDVLEESTNHESCEREVVDIDANIKNDLLTSQNNELGKFENVSVHDNVVETVQEAEELVERDAVLNDNVH